MDLLSEAAVLEIAWELEAFCFLQGFGLLNVSIVWAWMIVYDIIIPMMILQSFSSESLGKLTAVLLEASGS